jgi:hypothetical protein
VLDLQNFDMILGMEWLERYSPMKVHWTHITLHGILPGVLDYNIIELMQIQSDQQPVDSDQLPEEVQHLLHQYESVFATLAGLPPRRSCDHVIPLIPSATPVHSRPYRYAPTLKDEIEKQVREMLQAGIIQHNTSSFSSPVLLVKKKDGT